MALNARENINGNSPQDLNKLNNNFMTVWKTLFGGLDFSDTNNALKKKIQTQQLPVQGEGNFDKNFPLYIRFFVPTNVKSVTSTSFNLICERYRMDSGVAMDGGSVINAPINMSLASANTGIASVSSPTVGVSSVSSASGYGSTTSYVDYWGDGSYLKEAPYYPIGDSFVAPYDGPYSNFNWYRRAGTTDTLGVRALTLTSTAGEDTVNIVDMHNLQHRHTVSITIPAHSHSISMQPHTHSITLSPHTHEATAKLDIPAHTHALKEGIQISSTQATGVSVKLNGTVITTMDSSSNNTKNNLDVTDKINIGAWNVIECTTTSLARITLYGIIELIMNY